MDSTSRSLYKPRIIAHAAVLLLCFATAALAGEIEGKVKSIDPSDRTATLEDGTRVAIPDGMALDQLREGAEVRMSYEEKNGKNEATAIEVKERGRGGAAARMPIRR